MTDIRTEVLVVGSGAGGALTAARLAEAGRRVVVIEEGPHLEPDAVAPFSCEEMAAKYRSGGLTATLGLPPVNYVEARCVGGGTEINSGLYHRLPADVLEDWRRSWDIGGLDPQAMAAYATQVERDLSISPLPDDPPPASAVLDRGARRLGWSVLEVPRWYRYEADEGGGHRAVKQTMTRTFIPRAVAAGAQLIAGCKVRRLKIRGGRVRSASGWLERADGSREPVTIEADHVVVCAGAIGTPALLQRSGIRRRVGAGLKLHPTIKLAARFPDRFIDHSYVPMHQVKEFAPDVTLGGSAFRPGYVALALGDSWAENEKDMGDWERIGVYYASIRSDGSGRVVAVPGLDEPVVTYALRQSDLSRLARGLVHLAELLFAAGADTLYPSIEGAAPVRHPSQLADLWSLVRRDRVSLMTIHLFSTVGMGERRERTGADSFGRVWDVANLRVNDASLLPDAPGVNPQGTVMAIAARNCDQFLAQS